MDLYIGLKYYILIMVCLALLFVVVLFSIFKKQIEDNFSGVFFLLLFVFLALIGFSSPVFLLTFSIVVPIFQFNTITLSHITNELNNGLFGLRITSVIIGYNMIFSYFSFLKDDVKLKYEFPEVENWDEVLDHKNIFLEQSIQYTLYSITLTFLWVCTILHIESIFITMMRWAVFFISDDWLIISHFSLILKGRKLKCHIYRIMGFNILISSLLIIVFFINFKKIIDIPISFIVIIILSSLFIFMYPPLEKLKKSIFSSN